MNDYDIIQKKIGFKANEAFLAQKLSFSKYQTSPGVLYTLTNHQLVRIITISC